MGREGLIEATEKRRSATKSVSQSYNNDDFN